MKPSVRLFSACFLGEEGDTWMAHWDEEQRQLWPEEGIIIPLFCDPLPHGQAPLYPHIGS